MMRFLLVFGFVAAGLVGVSAPAFAECHTETVTITGKEGIKEVEKEVCTDDESDGAETAAPVDLGPVTETYHVPACSVNGPPGQGADALCGMAVNSCAADDEIRYYEYTRMVDPATGEPVAGGDGQWSNQGMTCRGPDDGGAGVQPPELTVEMVMGVAYTQAPVPVVSVQPEGESYVNVPNNFFVDKGPVDDTLTVLGRSVQVTYAPVVAEYAWDFGDGGKGSGAGIADAAIGQDGAVEYAYVRQGTYEVLVSANYRVTFTAPGLGTVTPPGTISETSEPVSVEIGEIQSVVTDVG